MHCEYNGCSVELRPEDITQAGVFVGTTAPLPIDSEIELRLCSQLGEIAVRCQVVQVISRARAAAEQRNPCFGVLFFDLSDDQRAFIGLTLDALSRAERARSAKAAARDKLAARRQNTLQQLERELQGQKDKSPWAQLGLPPDAPREAVRKAYLQQSKRFHPHVFAHLDSPEISQLATELFILQKRAYVALHSISPPALAAEPAEPEPERMLVPAAAAQAPLPLVPRASRIPVPEPRPDAAVTSLLALAPKTRSGVGMKPPIAPRSGSVRPPRAPTQSAGTGGHAGAPPRRRAVEAELILQEGLKHLAAGRFEQALPQIEQAQQLCPELREAAIWLHVGRARQSKAAGQEHAAIEEYRAVLELDPEHREALEHAGEQRRGRGKLIGKWFGASDE